MGGVSGKVTTLTLIVRWFESSSTSPIRLLAGRGRSWNDYKELHSGCSNSGEIHPRCSLPKFEWLNYRLNCRDLA